MILLLKSVDNIVYISSFHFKCPCRLIGVHAEEFLLCFLVIPYCKLVGGGFGAILPEEVLDSDHCLLAVFPTFC